MVVSWKTGEPIRISRSARLRFGRLRMPERMPVINGILNRCRRGLPFRSVQHLLWGDEDGSRSRGGGRRRNEFGIPLIEVGGLQGYSGMERAG